MTTREKAMRALAMRQHGIPWENIAADLGWTISTTRSQASKAKRWDFHAKMKSQRNKRLQSIYRGRGKKLVGVNWTAEMEAVLPSLWPVRTGDEIARILSIQFDVTMTRNAVLAKARRLKLPPKPPYRPGWLDRRPQNDNREREPYGRAESAATSNGVLPPS